MLKQEGTCCEEELEKSKRIRYRMQDKTK